MRDDVRRYLETALWSSTDEAGNSLDDGRDPDDCTPALQAQAATDLDNFYALLSPAVQAAYTTADLAHDFWLTRNGHGAGFWDGDYPEHGDELTKWSKTFGTVDLYVTDDDHVDAM